MAVTKILNSNTKSHGKITEITQNNKLKSNTNEGVVSKETVVLRRWGSSIQKFGFINGVDKIKIFLKHF